MSGVIPRFERGPVTYPAIEAVTGGLLVEGRVGGVGLAAVGSLRVIGVATKDAKPATSAETTDLQGRTVLDAYQDTATVAVGSTGFWYLTYAAAAVFGQRLVAAAGGQVTPYVTATHGADAIVGYCAEPSGVTAGAKGISKISV